jgi:hypothetical protein
MKNIEILIDDAGSISVTALAPIGCVAAASDGSNCLAMLVRRDGESLSQLIERLDKAIGLARSQGLFTDEVNNRNS